MWCLAADQTRIAALWHNFCVRLVAKRDDARDFIHIPWPPHAKCAAVIEAPILAEVGRHVGRLGSDIAGADDLAEPRQERGFVQHAAILGDGGKSPNPPMRGSPRIRNGNATNLAIGRDKAEVVYHAASHDLGEWNAIKAMQDGCGPQLG